jgi:hypothetical protein
MVPDVEPSAPRMIREDRINLRLALVALAIVNVVLLGGLVATAGVLLAMAGNDDVARSVAVKLHVAPLQEARSAQQKATDAASSSAATLQFAQDGLARLEARPDAIIDLQATVSTLKEQVDALTERLDAQCAWERRMVAQGEEAPAC